MMGISTHWSGNQPTIPVHNTAGNAMQGTTSQSKDCGA
jgi:hypothetical protein